MADLPGNSVAINSPFIMKLECFDKIGTYGKHTFENKFIEMAFSVYRGNNYSLCVGPKVRETTVLLHAEALLGGNSAASTQCTCTLDWVIFVVKNFCQSPSMTKIKPAKYFPPNINIVSSFSRVVISIKIKPIEK